VWDGGLVLTNHNEFSNRVIQMDTGLSITQHATHVAGTLCATGLNSDAKGMAYQSNVRAYNWSYDIEEMAQEASTGMLLSNHSYGELGGWDRVSGNYFWYGDTTVSSLIDYKFGFYSEETKLWDSIARTYPNYLIVKAAGNNRNDAGPISGYHYVYKNNRWYRSTTNRSVVGPYDCITTYANAKNILTIGAVDAVASYSTPSSVSMTNFSSWGPTDDGRIKPDIVADGVSLMSCSSAGINQYALLTGTSMATPSVTGTLLLVQQFAKQIYNKPLLASTLKALTIHTAKECGSSDGPDYSYGWGLMNAPAMIQTITNDRGNSRVLEKNLANSSRFDTAVNYFGSGPMTVTLCWTDLPGVVSNPMLNNRTSKLINDLDVRVYTPTGDSILPFKLNPNSPTNAATKGDNTVDNVEKIVINNPISGSYRISVRHKGTIAQTRQPYSLIFSGIGPSTNYVRFMSPRAGMICLKDSVLPIIIQGNRITNYLVRLMQGSTVVRTIYTSSSGFPYYNYWTPDSSILPGVYRIAVTTLPQPGSTYYSGDFVIVNHPNSFYSFAPDSGRYQSAVTLSGSGFSSSNRVYFNGVPAVSVSLINPTMLRVIVPAAASTGSIVVDFGTRADTSTREFRILPADCSTYPTINITSSSSTLCPNESLRLSIDTLIGSRIVWNDGYTGKSRVVNQPASFSAFYTNVACTSNVASINITFGLVPDRLQIGSLPNDTLQAMGTFINTDVLLWFKNGVIVPNSNTRKLKLTAAGKYLVSGISSSQCKTISDTVSVSVLGSREKVENEKVIVFPNPVSDFLNIEGLDNNQAHGLCLINSVGQTVLNTEISESNTKISVAHLASGIYQMVLKDARSVRVEKLLIEK
jgi:hypothetical protein